MMNTRAMHDIIARSATLMASTPANDDNPAHADAFRLCCQFEEAAREADRQDMTAIEKADAVAERIKQLLIERGRVL